MTDIDFDALSKEFDEADHERFAEHLDKLIEKTAAETPDEKENLDEIVKSWNENSPDEKLAMWLKQRRSLLTLRMREIRYQQEREEHLEEIELLRNLVN